MKVNLMRLSAFFFLHENVLVVVVIVYTSIGMYRPYDYQTGLCLWRL